MKTETPVNKKIEALLDRVHRLKAGSKVQTASTFFNLAAFKRAQAIARKDAEQ